MLASAVIDDARGFHESFTVQKHTEKVCLQELRRAEARAFRILSDQGALAAHVVFSEDEIAAALTGLPLGEGESLEMPAYSELLSAMAVSDLGTEPVALIQDERDGSTAQLRIMVIGGSLYLTQPAAMLARYPAEAIADVLQSWDGVTGLKVTFVPAPSPVATVGSELASPDQLRGYLVGCLIAFMASRRSSDLGDAYVKVMQAAGDMQTEALESAMTIGGRETPWSVRKVV